MSFIIRVGWFESCNVYMDRYAAISFARKYIVCDHGKVNNTWGCKLDGVLSVLAWEEIAYLVKIMSSI